MCLVDSVLSHFIDKFVNIFIDDIIVCSKSKEEHDQHLKVSLQTLRENELNVKYRKCTFYHKQIQYLGHVVSKEGIIVNLEDTRAITQC